MASVAAQPPTFPVSSPEDTLESARDRHDEPAHQLPSHTHTHTTDSMVSVRLSEPKSIRTSSHSATPLDGLVDPLDMPDAFPETPDLSHPHDESKPHRPRDRSSTDILHGVGFDVPTEKPAASVPKPLTVDTTSGHGRSLSTSSRHTQSYDTYDPELDLTTPIDDSSQARLSQSESVLFSAKPLSLELDDLPIESPSLATDEDNDSVIHDDNVDYADTDAEQHPDPEIHITDAEHAVSRSSSIGSAHDSDNQVDWEQLATKEEHQEKDEVSDESTAFLLARLEQENNALAADHRFGVKGAPRNQARPPSLQVLKRLVNDPNGITTRYSVLPDPPPMTELEFWAALVKDYPQTVQRLPTLTSNKIKGGVPPPLRGVVWVSMVGARDTELGDQFDKLCKETSPYESIIGKDIGRSFPGVEMFKDPLGEGQQMLARVLKSFSLYDKEIGYCQGLGFLVGPLLMQMGDKDAFCVLVRLMDNYDLRSCFRPDLSGLHLRIFQFQKLLTQHLPELAAHLASLQVEAAYLSQWFLSFFAVTCPLPMLFRIYDVIFAEGASETIMRVAMSLMRRNQERIMAQTEFEEVMQLLLSRTLWDPYACNADDLVNDFVSFTGMVTRESLQKLEIQFRETSSADTLARFAFFSDATNAASRFLGRLWTASAAKPNLLGPTAGGGVASKIVRRSPSKSSIASTIHSHSEGAESVATAITDATSRESGTENISMHSKSGSVVPSMGISKEDKDLHGQIEDLLTALSDMQRDQAILAETLQKEREERSEDHQMINELLSHLRVSEAPSTEELQVPSTTKADRRQTLPPHLVANGSLQTLSAQLGSIVERVDARLQSHRDLRRSSMLETKARLREQVNRSKDQLAVEMSRSTELSRRLDTQERETAGLREQLREARSRIQEGFAERNRLERAVQEMRARERASIAWSESDPTPMLWRSDTDQSRASISSISTSSGSVANTPNTSKSGSGSGLREFKLNRASVVGPSATSHIPQSSTGSFHPPRGQSLATKNILATKDHTPASEEEMLVELVNAKTAEAQAKHELEELRSKFDAMRRMLGMPTPPPSQPSPLSGPQASAGATAAAALSNLGSSMSSFFHRQSPSESTVVPPQQGHSSTAASETGSSSSSTPQRKDSQLSVDKLSPPVTTPGASGGGFWSAWGKRTASNSSSTAEKPILTGTPGPVEKS